MTGTHLGLEEDRPVALVDGSKPGHPFGRLPVGDPGVVQAGGGEDRRVLGREGVLVGAVVLEPLVLVGDGRVSPFLPFADRQRDARDRASC